jgi:hypothetical protein
MRRQKREAALEFQQAHQALQRVGSALGQRTQQLRARFFGQRGHVQRPLKTLCLRETGQHGRKLFAQRARTTARGRVFEQGFRVNAGGLRELSDLSRHDAGPYFALGETS